MKNLLVNVPTTCGVYKIFSENEEIIYIGKAKSLNERLISYTRKHSNSKVNAMCQQAARVDWILTNTEKEALILEAKLIKELQPKYNILLKDDKSFPYIVVSKHKFPRLHVVRSKNPSNLIGSIFGPILYAKAIKQLLNTIYINFKLRSCSDAFMQSRNRPCIEYDMQRCYAPCVFHNIEDKYKKSISQVKKILSSKNSKLSKSLWSEMLKASSNQDYVLASSLKKQYELLDALSLVRHSQCRIDYIIKENNMLGIYVLDANNVEYLEFFPAHNPLNLSHSAVILSLLEQYYTSSRWETYSRPKKILITNDLDLKLLQNGLNAIWDIKVEYCIEEQNTVAMQKGRELLLSKSFNKSAKQNKALSELLNLNINRVDVIDNSHLSGENAVSGVVVFIEGKFNHLESRHYSHVGFNTKDDLALMSAGMNKHLKNILTKTQRPDLLIIDGGRNQLQVVRALLMEYGINIPCLAIAKGAKRKPGEEKFFFAQTELATVAELSIHPQSREHLFLQNMRDKAHSFAIKWQRKKRLKTALDDPMKNIHGIGAVDSKKLLEKFKNISAIKKATIDELQQVSSIGPKKARAIWEYYNKNEIDGEIK